MVIVDLSLHLGMFLAHVRLEGAPGAGDGRAIGALILHADIHVLVNNMAHEAAPIFDQLPAWLALKTLCGLRDILVDERVLHRCRPGRDSLTKFINAIVSVGTLIFINDKYLWFK